MKFQILQLIMCFTSIGVVFADELASPIDNRYSDIVDAEQIEQADVDWLVERLATGGVDECIAIALLFRADSKRYSDDFAKYFHLEKVDHPIVLSEEEVNQEVNQVLQTYGGRKPLEIASRVYLSFRDSNKVFTRGDSRIYLEMMFRASVLSGTVRPTEDELLKLSAFVDSPMKDSNKAEESSPSKPSD